MSSTFSVASWRLSVLASVLLGCAANPYRAPSALRAYEILLPARDTLGRAFAAEFERAGLRVRHEPRGGGPPVATLIYYEFAAPPSVGGRWFHGRLYDVRSSRLLAAATIVRDSLPPGGRERARVVVAALLAPRDSVPTPDEPIE